MTRIILVRHGESEANIQGVLAGHHDVSLTALGVDQAEQTAAHLASWQINAVYSSDLMRAMQTAKPHAERRGIPVIPEPRFREIFCGAWEGLSYAYLTTAERERFVGQFQDNFGLFKMPDGEGIEEGGYRMYHALIEIARRHEGQTVLIASHGAVLRALWCIMRGVAPHEWAKWPFPSNASYSVAEFDGNTLVAGDYSCDSHLSAVTTVNFC